MPSGAITTHERAREHRIQSDCRRFRGWWRADQPLKDLPGHRFRCASVLLRVELSFQPA